MLKPLPNNCNFWVLLLQSFEFLQNFIGTHPRPLTVLFANSGGRRKCSRLARVGVKVLRIFSVQNFMHMYKSMYMSGIFVSVSRSLLLKLGYFTVTHHHRQRSYSFHALTQTCYRKKKKKPINYYIWSIASSIYKPEALKKKWTSLESTSNLTQVF